MLLYAYGGLSSRQVPRVMELHNLIWGGLSEKLPSHVTIIDWVEKCGLSTVQGSMSKKTAKEAYPLIIDNSITVCGQDLHLELKTASGHPGHPHKQTDVSVARMVVGKNWNKEATKRQLSKTIESVGRKPDYVVCDNGETMCNARFMNVFDTIHLAKAVIENEHLLNSREKYMLSFVKSHASLVEELHDVMAGYEYMEQLCKEEGLSHKTARMCRDYVMRNFMTKGDRVRNLGDILKIECHPTRIMAILRLYC